MSSEVILASDSGDSGDSASSTASSRYADSSNYCLFEDNRPDRLDKCIDVKCVDERQRKEICCGNASKCLWGVLLVVLSVAGFIFTPMDLMLWEKLNMRPGLPPYEWWADPPDEVKLRAYVFNVTNHERFLAGEDPKLNVDEIGPIVYLEKLLHSNIRFNENSTMTYTAKRYPIFLPDENDIDLNATLIVPNMAVLGLTSYLHNAPYLIKTAFRLLVSSQNSPVFAKKTVYEYLWEYNDPVLDLSKSLAPGLVPVNNMGMLARIYSDFTDEMTVKVGPRWGHEEFFQIDRFRGNKQLPGYDPEICPDRIQGSTEGVMYQQRLTKQDVLLYWRKTVCKLMPLYFDSEMSLDDVPVYRYNLSESVFERVTNETDCYDTVPTLPSGVSDASKCYFDFPMVVSYPHFYTGGIPKDKFVTGLKPDREKHNSFVIVEPFTGTPFHSVARMQSNLHIYDLSGFSTEHQLFSNMIIPLFWAEYNQEGLPPRISRTIYFMVVILQPVTKIFLALTLLLGFYLVMIFLINFTKLKNDSIKTCLILKSKKANTLSKVNTLAKTTIFSYEKEPFLKRTS